MFKPFYCCLVCSRRTLFCSSRSAHSVLQAVLCSPCIANVLKSHFKDVQPGLFFIRIFRVLNTVQSFIFKVHVVAASAATCYILSQRFLSVNNFFYFFHFYFSAETSLFSQLRFSGKLSTGVDAQSAPPLRLFYSLIFTRRIPPCNLPGILQYPGRLAGAWSSALIPCTEP